MGKCIRCGSSSLFLKNCKLADAEICMKCVKELGFWSDSFRLICDKYKYADIKDGYDAYFAKKKKNEIPVVFFSDYGQDRILNCTEEEQEIYEQIRTILEDAGCDLSPLELVRKSDDYVSAVMVSSGDYGKMDVARIKSTPRVKWIKICPDFDKIQLESPEDVAGFAENLIAAYRFNEPYL